MCPHVSLYTQCCSLKSGGEEPKCVRMSLYIPYSALIEVVVNETEWWCVVLTDGVHMVYIWCTYDVHMVNISAGGAK